MSETSAEYAMTAEPLPAYLERYAAEVDRWHQESVSARVTPAS